MSAAPIGPGPLPWSPDPLRQLLADHKLEDVLDLPDDAPRIELVDGVMVVVPSPSYDHQRIGFLLCRWLDAHCPPHLVASIALGVQIDDKNSCEPDVLLHRAADISPDAHLLKPEDVSLVIEIVSPSTRRRDRFGKPGVYAEAGIPYFWRVEQNPLQIHAYTLTDGVYKDQATSTDELVLDEPFPIRLPIREITP